LALQSAQVISITAAKNNAEPTVIHINQISKQYGAFKVLDDCTTSVARGEVVVVCGPSGSGKSTLIKCVNGLEPFQSGEIVVDGVSVGAPSTRLSALRARVGMVFQHFELFPHMSVLDNVTLAQVKVIGRRRDEAEVKALALLDRVGLREQAGKFPAKLSGGQQQRVAIVRALSMEPAAMLTMMVVTHEMGFARKVADRIVFMERGAILEDTSAEQFFAGAKSERAQQFLSRILTH
jgi:glutamate/aspartate transport system ATP-binding protein